ncbi:CLUMA_CG016827, isoform A [Clunio marinus]|uniref:CLUMA_CG016827, isoform A n=1 Tax=Clunio marinus TaxID=568069 RepID=A0A1J1IU69_9DIPT|nr:CLUMA_CG016827, isoform A [Clunio marinus]
MTSKRDVQFVKSTGPIKVETRRKKRRTERIAKHKNIMRVPYNAPTTARINVNNEKDSSHDYQIKEILTSASNRIKFHGKQLRARLEHDKTKQRHRKNVTPMNASQLLRELFTSFVMQPLLIFVKNIRTLANEKKILQQMNKSLSYL